MTISDALPPKRLDMAWTLMGFSSMIAQVVLLRESLVVFSGNEASMGIMLACWLFWVGVGSIFLGRACRRSGRKMELFVLCQLLLAGCLPVIIFLMRISKGMLGISPGEIAGIVPILCISAVLLAPPCLVLGLLFALSCQMPADDQSGTAVHVGRVYVLEAVGATAGGAVFSYVLVRLLDSFQIVWLLSMLNVISALTLARWNGLRRKKAWTGVIVIMLCAMFAFGVLETGHMHRLSLERQWSGFDVVYSENSIYGNITVTERAGQENYFESGLHMFSYPDPMAAEELAHMALLQHPNPAHVLLVGGGVNGSLAEILKHPVDHVTYVELDPHIVNVARARIPGQDLMLDNPRVSVLHLDGRLYIRRCQEKFDVIMVNLPEPFTTQLNRFYTVEFFTETKRLLKQGGLLAFRLSSSEDYISNELAQLLGSFFFTLRQVFPAVEMIPGSTNIFLACSSDDVLSLDPGVMLGRIRERAIETAYVGERYLPYRMAAERVNYLRDRLARQENARLNTDFHPISAFYDMVHWTTQFGWSVSSAMKSLSRLSLGALAIPLAIITVIMLIVASRVAPVRHSMLLVAVGITGAMGIILEVIILLTFQVLYGYVYAKMGIILTGFMVGLTLGGGWMTRRLRRDHRSYRDFLWIQSALCLYPLIMIILFRTLTTISQLPLVFLSSEVLFPVLIASGGFLAGAQFPLANALYVGRTEHAGAAGGTIYGLDVLGSSLGALTAGSVLIPVLGIWNACLVLSLLGLCALVLLLPGIWVPAQQG